MAQWLSPHPALAEDPSVVPGTQHQVIDMPVAPTPGDPTPSSGL